MASKRPTFKVSQRSEFGSRTARRLRRDGQIPGVVYTSGKEARPFQADGHDISLFLAEGHALFDLEIEGAGAVPVVVKEQQRHPVRGDLIHLDFQEVDLDTAIQADVAIEVLGTDDAPGVKVGGILEHVTREVTVEALPTDIPEMLSADVSGMEIGDTLNLDSVVLPEGVKLVADAPEEITIATLNPPKVEEEPEIEEETELVGEGEEPAEGEEAESEGADGDDDSGGDEG